MGGHVVVIEVIGKMVKGEQRQGEHDGAGQKPGIVPQPVKKRRKRFPVLVQVKPVMVKPVIRTGSERGGHCGTGLN